jgi:CheY-like chemotaxis protein
MVSTNQSEVGTTKTGYTPYRSMYNPDRYSFLMAEDNPDDILITKRAWKKGNIKNKLHIVNDGEETLDFLYKKGEYVDAPSISLMLLDLNMPKMNGFEVLETIKKDTGLKSLPVIVLTTSNRDEDIQRAYDLGCNSYIVKPVNYDNFLKAVIEIQRYWILLCELPNNKFSS